MEYTLTYSQTIIVMFNLGILAALFGIYEEIRKLVQVKENIN